MTLCDTVLFVAQALPFVIVLLAWLGVFGRPDTENQEIDEIIERHRRDD